MKPYKQLNQEQRYQISGLRKAGWKQARIAEEVGVNKSTISRELSRNKGKRGWHPKQAQTLRDERRHACANGKQFLAEEWREVERLIRDDFSPEQAANRLELEGVMKISHECIYRHVYADKLDGGDLHQHYVARNRAASDTRADRNDGERSKTGSASMLARKSSRRKRASGTGRAIPLSGRTTRAGW